MDMPPIHTAVVNGDLEGVRRLVEDDPQVVDSIDRGCTPFFTACRRGRVQIAAVLLDHGANINYQELYNCETSLLRACVMDHFPVVELLMERGANPAIRSTNDNSPLMVASTRGHVNIVRCLLNHHHFKATTTSRSSNHALHEDVNKALWFACHKGYVEIVRMLLLETGADPLPREHGCSAMRIAKEKGHQECVKVIEEWERSYLLTKARRLYDTYHRHHHIASHPNPPQHDDDSRAKKRVRVKGTARAVVPIYVKGRMKKGQQLPKVEVIVEETEEVSVGGVLEYVVCGGLKVDLFVELMEMMGRVG